MYTLNYVHLTIIYVLIISMLSHTPNDNLPDSLRFQDLNGVSICDRHRNELENEFFNQYTGVPTWVSCNPVYCPNDPECQ